MTRGARGLLRRLDRDRGVRRERAQDFELVVARTQAAARLADREDREHSALGVLERNEQLVLGMPCPRVVERLHRGHVAGTDVLGPIE